MEGNEVSKLAGVATLPTCPIVIWSTNHKYRIFLTLTYGGPARTIFILVTAISTIGSWPILLRANAFQIKEFGGEPQITLEDGTSTMVTTPIRSCIEV